MAEQGAIYRREIFPVRLWIRRHYTKIRRTLFAKCNHCLKQILIQPSFLLHNHLIKEHSNELTKEEMKDKRTQWTWDHITIKDIQNATCNICGAVLKYHQGGFIRIRIHLKTVHGILPPFIDDMDNANSDANTDTATKKDQIHSATSSKINKNTEQIGVLDKNVADHILNLPLQRDVENHDLDLSIHKDADIIECLSFPSQSSAVAFFDIEFCEEIFNLFTQE